MKKLSAALALTAVLGVGAILPVTAQAAPAGQLGVAADALNVVDHVQYVYGGYRHCWYANGWKGPGWYRCGYRTRVGYGWGGPAGWNGWVYSAPVVVVAPRGHYYYHGHYYHERYRGPDGYWRYR